MRDGLIIPHLAYGEMLRRTKLKYYELSKKHHPDVSQDPNSPETFRRVTEAYAVLGNKKTRRKYDQREQLHSALVSTFVADEMKGNSLTSTPRPVDPTFWDPVKLGSSTFYRPPPGYWTAVNQLVRDREKSNAQKVSSQPPSPPPPHDKTEGNKTRNPSNKNQYDLPELLVIAMAITLAWEAKEWLLRCIKDYRDSLVQLGEVSENESNTLQRDDSTSQATRHNQDLVRGDDILEGSIVNSQAQLADAWVELESSIDGSQS
ncbi:hypothetical protein K503DRAFT_599447 [Rhizopogon vinicolor AM-OR11-026]|uniref:J domain-containing protein n=1 Tax=Rhizopogon vinicolor AM-OR11-026 TaxID=1314800 RepID=A0A1B7N6T8_9AGAM|nr:hypothetical protein K503DRAFT_599447 [Rhizopogon vinicolor AM-OR11-026]